MVFSRDKKKFIQFQTVSLQKTSVPNLLVPQMCELTETLVFIPLQVPLLIRVEVSNDNSFSIKFRQKAHNLYNSSTVWDGDRSTVGFASYQFSSRFRRLILIKHSRNQEKEAAGQPVSVEGLIYSDVCFLFTAKAPNLLSHLDPHFLSLFRKQTASLRVVCFSSETSLQKTNFSFAGVYQLKLG